MPRVVGRIRRRSTFSALARPEGRARRPTVRVAYSRSLDHPGCPGAHVAYAIARRTGPAVIRNRARRRLRAAVDAVACELPTGSYLLSAGPATIGASHDVLVRDVREAMGAAAMGAGAPVGTPAGREVTRGVGRAEEGR